MVSMMAMLLLWMVVLLTLVVEIAHSTKSSPVLLRAPSVFPSEEKELHKYAAILAAAEPFRLLCLAQIERSLSLSPSHSHRYTDRARHWLSRSLNRFRSRSESESSSSGSGSGSAMMVEGMRRRDTVLPIDVALTRLEMRVQSIAGSFGMTVEEFNGLSAALNQQPQLRKKVLLQSYFYKIAADLESNLKNGFTLPALPTMDEDPTLHKNRYPYAVIDSAMSKYPDQSPPLVNTDTEITGRFATALINLEAERLSVRDKLKKILNIKSLPASIGDPNMLSAMAAPIQQANKDFPTVASRIIGRCGLQLEEFHELQEKLQRDKTFKQEVQHEISSRTASKNV